MPTPVFTLIAVALVAGSLGVVLGAVLAALGVLWARQQLDGHDARVRAEAVTHALGMVRDITQVRAATPPSTTPHLDAIQAETAAWELGRKKRLAAESDERFGKELGK